MKKLITIKDQRVHDLSESTIAEAVEGLLLCLGEHPNDHLLYRGATGTIYSIKVATQGELVLYDVKQAVVELFR